MATKLKPINEDQTMSGMASLHQSHLQDSSFVRNVMLGGILGKYRKEDQLLEENHSTDPRRTTTNISRKNWEISYRKWKWLVVLARLHVKFHTMKGFSFLKVVGKCGYCIEYNSNCFNCSLYKQDLCCSVNNLTKEKRENTVFWKYIRVMRKSVKDCNVKINWKKDVLAYATEMRDAIKKDEPKRQIKTSSIFTSLQLFFPKVA